MGSKGIFLKPIKTPRPASPVVLNSVNRNRLLMEAIGYLNEAIECVTMDGCKCTKEDKCINCMTISDIKNNIVDLYRELNKENRI